jgi:hypothetical protein
MAVAPALRIAGGGAEISTLSRGMSLAINGPLPSDWHPARANCVRALPAEAERSRFPLRMSPEGRFVSLDRSAMNGRKRRSAVDQMSIAGTSPKRSHSGHSRSQHQQTATRRFRPCHRRLAHNLLRQANPPQHLADRVPDIGAAGMGPSELSDANRSCGSQGRRSHARQQGQSRPRNDRVELRGFGTSSVRQRERGRSDTREAAQRSTFPQRELPYFKTGALMTAGLDGQLRPS